VDGAPAIRIALGAIRNVGPGAAREIIRERAAHGAYQSIDGLCRRIDQRVVNRRALDSLVKGGACDCFNLPRQRMCLIADDAAATWDRNGDSALQRSFFDTFDDTDVPTSAVRPQLESVGEWDDSTRLGFEQEALGVYVTGHPLDSYAATWRALVTADARELGFTDQGQDETPVFAEPESEAIEIMGGLLVNCDWRMSRRRKAYGVLTFEDMYGTFEALLWQDMVNQYRQTLKPGQVWMTAGPIRTSYNRRSLSVLRLATAEDALASWPRALRITVTVATEDDALLQQLAEQLRAHPGETPVELALTNTATGHSVVVDTGELRVALSETLLSALEALAGQSSVHCRYTP
jgi:DNA polymerase-3 subunit alpha